MFLDNFTPFKPPIAELDVVEEISPEPSPPLTPKNAIDKIIQESEVPSLTLA